MILNKQSIQKFTTIVYTLTLIGILNPFFFWDGYRNGILSSNGIPMLKILYVFALLTGAVSIMYEKRIDIQKMKLFGSVMICLLVFEFICGINNFSLNNIAITSILNMLLVGMFCLFPETMKYQIYQKFKLFFVISIIPGIIYSILTFAGISFSFETLSAASEIKQNSYVTYLHSPFAVQISKSYDLIGNLNRFRLCGIYDEPGRVGTVSAFFLTAEDLQINKDWKNRILFVGGILSLSLAFFIIIAFAFAIKLIHQKRFKYFAILIVAILSFAVFMNIDFHNVALNSLQNRLSLTATGLAGDNRTDAIFDSFFESFMKNSSFFNVLFGNGDGSIYRYATEHAMGYSSSYKCIIYDIGILGTIMYLIWIIRYGWFYNRGRRTDWFIVTNILVFIISLYQRPNIFNPSYLLIPLAGIAAHCLVEVEDSTQIMEK